MPVMSVRQKITGLIFSRSLRQGMVVLFDQGFTSLVTFLTGILVARSYGEDKAGYGYYVLALTILLNVKFIPNAIISLPFTVYSPHLDRNDNKVYFGSTFVHFVWLVAVIVAGIGICAFSLSLWGENDKLPLVVAMLCFAAPFALLRDFVRFFLLAQLHTWSTLAMGAACNIVAVVLLIWTYATNSLNASAAYAILGISSGLPALAVLALRRSDIEFSKRNFLPDFRKNWRFGKWLLAASCISIGSSAAIPWFIYHWHDDNTVAVFGALFAISGLIRPAIRGLAAYVTPKVAHRFRASGYEAAIYQGSKAITLITLASLIYMAVMCIWGDYLVVLLYPEGYGGHVLSLVLIAVSMALQAVCTTQKGIVRAVSHPNIEFWSSAIQAIVAVLLSLVLIRNYGILGAAITLVSGNLSFIVSTYLILAVAGQRNVSTQTAD